MGAYEKVSSLLSFTLSMRASCGDHAAVAASRAIPLSWTFLYQNRRFWQRLLELLPKRAGHLSTHICIRLTAHLIREESSTTRSIGILADLPYRKLRRNTRHRTNSLNVSNLITFLSR